jgi:hypothetical protein
LVAPQVGDDAERAAVVTALSYPQVGHRRVGGAVAGDSLIGNVIQARSNSIDPLSPLHPLDDLDDLVIVARTHDSHRLRDLLQQLLLEVLRQAAGNDDLFALYRQLHQGTDRLPSRCLDEATGVDNHIVSALFVPIHPVARLGQQAQHVLGVHPVFLTAQVQDGNGRGLRRQTGGAAEGRRQGAF